VGLAQGEFCKYTIGYIEAGPEVFADEHGENAGHVIKPDDVEDVCHVGEHVGSMRQRKLNKRCKDFDRGRSTS